MKVYKSNNSDGFGLVGLVVSLIVLSSFIWGFKLSIEVFIIWGFLMICLLLYNTEEKITEIILNEDSNEIIFVRTSMFNMLKKRQVVSIDKVNCFFYQKRGSSLVLRNFLKFEIEKEASIVLPNNWDLSQLRNIEKSVNSLKNNN